MKSKGLLIGCGAGAVLVIILIGIAMWGVGIYNDLVKIDESVTQSWSQVENQYQRRLDLIPNLVNTVKGVAEFEKETYTAVTEARSKVGQINAGEVLNDPAKFQQFQAAQGELSSALSRLMVVVENYPQLKANENFLQLQAQLEGTENRISVERMKFTQRVQEYNTRIRQFPANIIAGVSGFAVKPNFAAQEGAEQAPKVEF